MSVGGKPYCMVKADLFWGPLGWLLRKMGGIPVDRKRGSNVALSVIKEMKAQKVVHLALAPEGTRQPVKRWKTGFHTIAREVGCPSTWDTSTGGTSVLAVVRKWNSQMTQRQTWRAFRPSTRRCILSESTRKCI